MPWPNTLTDLVDRFTDIPNADQPEVKITTDADWVSNFGYFHFFKVPCARDVLQRLLGEIIGGNVANKINALASLLPSPRQFSGRIPGAYQAELPLLQDAYPDYDREHGWNMSAKRFIGVLERGVLGHPISLIEAIMVIACIEEYRSRTGQAERNEIFRVESATYTIADFDTKDALLGYKNATPETKSLVRQDLDLAKGVRVEALISEARMSYRSATSLRDALSDNKVYKAGKVEFSNPDWVIANRPLMFKMLKGKGTTISDNAFKGNPVKISGVKKSDFYPTRKEYHFC